ncbi:MAG: PAS domain S-box protein [Desulfobulbaceae bacterium]|nr:PAS domain S-box protein [Desulfobulbaceae bacterium]
MDNSFMLLTVIFLTLSGMTAVVLKRHRDSNVVLLPQRLRKRVHPLFIGVIVFLLQLTLMMTLHPFCKDWSSPMSGTLEAALFLLLITPILYYLLVVPLVEVIADKREMEKSLRQSEEFFRTTFYDAPLGAAIVNLDGTISNANAKLADFLGYAVEELSGRHITDLVHPDCREGCREQIAKLISGENREYNKDKQFVTKEGRFSWGYLSVKVITDHSDMPQYLLPMIEDINARKDMEQELTFAWEDWQETFAHIPDGVVILNQEFEIVRANPAFKKLLNTENERGRKFYNIIPCKRRRTCEHYALFKQSTSGSGTLPYFPYTYECYNDVLEKFLELTVNTIRSDDARSSGYVFVVRDVTERKMADQRLRLLEKAVNTTRTGVTFMDTDNIIRYINPADAAMHGYRPEELLGQHIRIIAPYKYIKTLDRDKMASLTTWSREIKNLRKDGSEFPVSLVSDVVRDESGEVLGIITTCEDITERIQIEEELRKLSRAIEQSPVSVVITNQQGAIEYVNPAFCANTGYSFAEAIGQNPRILKSGNQPAEVYQDLWQTISTGNIWRGELSNKTRAGEIFWENVAISPIKDHDGNITSYIAVKENITEQKKAKDAILNSEARLRSIMDGVTDSLITVDENGVIESCNPATEKIFGYPVDELVGENVQLLLPQVYHRRLDKFFQQRPDTAVTIGNTLTFRGRRKDGNSFPLSLSLGMAQLADRTLFAATIRDISEIKENQRALLEAKANAEMANMAKSDFLARMSHEIRTPMNAIIGMSNLVRMTSLGSQQVHYVNNIYSASKSLLRIINDILDFSKIEAGLLSLESIGFRLDDLFNNLKNIVGLPAYDKGIELMFDLDDALPEILIGDPLRVEQVLINLVNNAVKFTSDGQIIVKARAISVEAEKAVIEFTVSDTGIGMDPAQVESLFLPFTQADGSISRQYGGTGLGLTICKRLVEMMGGEIRVTSVIDKGSTFNFTLELPCQENISATNRSLHGVKAIVIDANPESRRLLDHFLKSADIRTVSAGAIEEADEAFSDNGGGGTKQPDLLVVDATSSAFRVTPVYDWLKDHPKVKTIFITGLAINPELKENKTVYAAYLSKPVIKSQLLDTVQRVMQLSTPNEKLIIGPAENMDTMQIIGGRKVLLAEDNSINQLYAVKILENIGLDVHTVKNGREALEAVCANKYDLVLMDMEMPVMDGLKATAEIRRIEGCRDLPIVAMTAHAMEEHKQLALNSGMNDYISKPIEMKDLNQVLQKWLAQDNQELNGITHGGTGKTDTRPDHFPGIDFTGGLSRLAGDRDLYLQVLSFFYETYSRAAGTLSTTLRQGKKKDAIIFVHSMNGAAGNIGAHQLCVTGKEIELVLSHSKDNLSMELIQRFENELARVLGGLAALSGEEPEK